MHLRDYDTDTRYQARVKESARITPPESTEEVREIVLDVERTDFSYHVGHSIGVLVPGPHALGHEFHFRLYTVADTPEVAENGKQRIKICVRRCSYIDEYSGERYEGVASNYLCDRQRGDEITITGPYRLPFQIPDEKDANLLMIGMGTGIAPFRALVKHIYEKIGSWEGKLRLFYGARTGLELLYMNDEKNDFAKYYDRDTFEAFEAVSPRPHWDEPVALGEAIAARAKEVWELLEDPKTYVFIAGLEKIRDMLESTFVKIAGSKKKWERRKAELAAGGRWAELLY